jgi:hypothetical protein
MGEKKSVKQNTATPARTIIPTMIIGESATAGRDWAAWWDSIKFSLRYNSGRGAARSLRAMIIA